MNTGRRERRIDLKRAAIHGVGVTATALGLGWMIVGGASVAMWGALGEVELLRQVGPEALAHVCLSGLVWWMGVSAYDRMRRTTTRRMIQAARGTVVTETLIALVPFLLLTSGLGQLAVNNMAGILTNYAAYSAGRAMWVWEPTSVTTGQQRARIAAAAAVTPVSPGTNTFIGNTPAEAKQFRNIVYASFAPFAFIGGSSLAGAAEAETLGTNFNTFVSFNNALDSNDFRVRAARKFTFAYNMVTVTRENGSGIGAKVVYQHYQAFPWFGWIFGRYGMRAGRLGYYLPITRTYTLPTQVR